uniref:Uncharacterized protein n=1 Tax=Arundo donax TaxID=35708 RepID=A0A0A9ELG7_ARUDO
MGKMPLLDYHSSADFSSVLTTLVKEKHLSQF